MAPTVLSLCSGSGAFELAVRAVFPAARVVGYCEWESYSAAVLLARMEDASLEPAPIWCGDLAELPTAPFLGVDLITAGFSCQPWSTAGQRRGTDDERWIWPDIARLVRELGPRMVYLENVPGLISGGGLELVLGDLAESGFDAVWTCLRASDVGAPHQRERVFILAYTDGPGGPEVTGGAYGDEAVDGWWPAQHRNEPDGNGEDVAYADGPPGPGASDEWAELLDRAPGLEPSLRREPDESAHWLGTAYASRDDQLRTLGNGVVPAQAAAALRALLRRAQEVEG